MSTPFNENFDKVAFAGSQTSNVAPGAALEAQNIGRSQARATGAPEQLADSQVSFPRLTEYGAKPVSEIQRTLNSVERRPSVLLNDGVFQAGADLERLRQAQPVPVPADAAARKVNDLSVVVTTDPVKDLAVKADNSATANFLVRKDGSIQLLSDPDRDPGVNKDHKLVVAVEADGNHVTDRSEAQQKSMDALTKYLATLYMTENGKLAGTINDMGLISADVKKALGAVSPEDALPDSMRKQVDNLNQVASASQAYLAPQAIDSYAPSGNSRYQHRYTTDTNEMATENAWAGMSGEHHQYTAVRNVVGQGRGFGVGRYAITYDMFLRWFMGMDMVPGYSVDDLAKKDKDRAKYDSLVAQMVKDGKLSKEMAAEFTSPKFKEFMAKLQAGGKLTPELEKEFKRDIAKYMPAELQEKIGADVANGFRKELLAQKGHVDQRELMAALLLGHLPTKDDMNNPAYKALFQQADNARQLSIPHLQQPKEGVYHFSGVPSSPMAAKLASHFMDHARSSTPGGWCAGKLATSMAEAGLGKWRDDATPMAHSMLRSGEWVAINPDRTAPGDVVYRPHASGRGGHIEGVVSVGPKGYLLASDFNHTLQNIRDNNNGYYKGLTVMRYVGAGGAKALDS